MEELARERSETIGREKLEFEALMAAGVSASIRNAADRLLADHHERTKELREGLKVRTIATCKQCIVRSPYRPAHDNAWIRRQERIPQPNCPRFGTSSIVHAIAASPRNQSSPLTLLPYFCRPMPSVKRQISRRASPQGVKQHMTSSPP